MQATLIAYVIYSFLFVLFFGARLYYLIFCAVLLLAGGASALAYAPALWVVPDLVIWFSRKLSRGR